MYRLTPLDFVATNHVSPLVIVAQCSEEKPRVQLGLLESGASLSTQLNKVR